MVRSAHVTSLCSLDHSELKYGRELVLEGIRRKYESNQQLSGILRLLESNYVRNDALTSPFIFCLSEHSDMLSQWRGYANDGSGVAIGVNIKILCGDFQVECRGDAHTTLEQNNVVLNKVIYTPERQEALIDLCLEISELKTKKDLEVYINFFLENKLNTRWEFPDKIDVEDITLAMLDNLLYLTKLYKHPGFKEEAEWRITTIP